MEVQIQKTEFLRALALAKAVSDQRSPMMPILGHTLLRADGVTGLTVAATDLNVTIVASLGAKGAKPGALAVPAKALHEIVKGLPADEVRLNALDRGRLAIASGQAHFTLVGLSAQDFPKLPDAGGVEFGKVETTVLAALIGKTLHAVSTDETRPHMCGALLATENGTARMVATDGHRMAIVERPWNGGPALTPGVLVPRKGLAEIGRLLGSIEANTCELGVHDGRLFVRAAGTLLAVRLTDATFPSWEQIVPKDNERQVVVARAALVEALDRVSLVGRNGQTAVRFDLKKGHLGLAVEDADLGEGREEIDVTYDGQPFGLAFNARYLTDILEALDGDRVRLELAGELDAAVVRPEGVDGQVGIVMPMRI